MFSVRQISHQRIISKLAETPDFGKRFQLLKVPLVRVTDSTFQSKLQLFNVSFISPMLLSIQKVHTEPSRSASCQLTPRFLVFLGLLLVALIASANAKDIQLSHQIELVTVTNKVPPSYTNVVDLL